MLPIEILENGVVRLTPLQSGDWNKLLKYSRNKNLWTGFPWDLWEDSLFEKWMEDRVMMSQEGKWYPFLVNYKKINEPIGLSCYLNVDEPNLVLEIGGTWYGAPFHGTEVNPNCKLLLMTYAFERLGYERVEYKTDVLNTRSRRAIEKLGAKLDGIMRSNRIVQNGRRRDTVYYSILKDEWPDVKQGLKERIANYS
ncbi:GNAT family N-acetyltransferase [Marinoscillum sp. MHG1-6]|uniref:GNAT family N-acetyltransferase n=1 Tax=Marinoscillum sp. MHG1-6 TaxID=2959627 RepID=UPI0021576B91|nr:GNAT family protein [Marinoscillum sp. MHG1-6]